MKKNNFLFIIGAYLMLSNFAYGQTSISINKIIKTQKSIELSVLSSKPFYVGGNIHILHIGNKDFSLYKQNNKDGKGTITFNIPIEEFNKLKEGENVWMSYGDMVSEKTNESNDVDLLCEQNPNTCWALGKLNKKITKN